ncbi:MAG: FAD-dependent oxidoreductase [Thiolinea sp.]
MRYHPGFVLRHALLFSHFLWHALPAHTPPRIQATHQLLQHSQQIHQAWLQQAGQSAQLREGGWLKLFRSEKQFQQTRAEQQAMQQQGVRHQVLDPAAIRELEPHIQPVFARGLLINDILSSANPAAVARTYAEQFTACGGQFLQQEVTALRPAAAGGWQVATSRQRLHCEQVVVALGPWSKALLHTLGLHLPLFYERGGHRHLQPLPDQSIRRPLYDAAGAYVITPMQQGLRITCGVELNARDAPYRSVQLDQAETLARTAFPVGARTTDADWMGCRPTLPDSLPAIGPTRLPGLWLNTGHQHLGFSTAPGSAALLAALLCEETPAIAAEPFAPARFGL